MSGVNPFALGLLKFCLQHVDSPNLKETDPSKYGHDSEDYKWLMDALNTLETDSARLKKLIQILKEDNKTKDEITFTLEGIQYLVEDINVANNFDKLEGFEQVGKLLNHEDEVLRKWSAWIIGTTCHNNPTAQISAIKHNTLQTLVNIIKKETDGEAKNKQLSAISGIISNNIPAQIEFIDKYDGLILVSQLLDQNSVSLRTKALFILIGLLHSQEQFNEIIRNTEIPKQLVHLLSVEENISLVEKVIQTLTSFANLKESQEKLKGLGLSEVIQNKTKTLNEEYEDEIKLMNELEKKCK